MPASGRNNGHPLRHVPGILLSVGQATEPPRRSWPQRVRFHHQAQVQCDTCTGTTVSTEARGQTCSEVLADFVANLRFEHLPSEVVTKVKMHVLDSVGVALAGSTTEWCQQGSRVFLRLGGPPEATVFGQGNRIAAPNAAIANSIAIAAMDYDDTDYEGGGCHMSRSVVPSALAVGEAFHRCGKDVLTALVAGYEVATRVGSALLLDRYGPRAARSSWGPEDLAAHHQMQRQGGALVRGYIPGLFASALVAGNLLGLDKKQLVAAQGLVGGLGLFLGQSHREGTDALLLHAGWASHAGIIAALWAREGLRGPSLVYEGDRGLLPVVGGKLQDPTRLTNGLGTEWNSLNNVLKFYPGGHGTHHFIESLKILMSEHQFKPKDVREIECRAPAQRVEFHFEPQEAKLRPTPYNARFSLPYLLARLLADGELGPLSFTLEKVSDPGVLELARRVTYCADERAWFGEKRGLVTVKLRDGRTLSRSTPDLLGFPNRPCSREDVLGKFRANAKLVLYDPERLDALVNAVEALEQVEDINNVMQLTVPEQALRSLTS